MNNTCPYPGCNAAYDLTGQPVGMRFSCKQCGQFLVVDQNGLQRANGGVTPPPVNSAAKPVAASQPTTAHHSSSSSSATTAASPAPSEMLSSAGEMASTIDRGTWLFVSGAILSLCTLFFPSIDQAKVSRLEAMIVAGDLRQTRVDAEGERAGGDAKAAAEKAKERWRDRKADLEESAESAEMWRRGWLYYYRYLSLAGFVLLLLGSVAYMDPRQTPARRIVGTIVLTALVLVVISSLARTGVRLEVG